MITVQFFTFSPLTENTYILYNDTGDALIIDPGCYFNEEKQKLQNYIEIKQLQPVQLINTHCHLDHVFGNKWVSEKYGLELFIHPNEERVLAFASESGRMYGIPFENYRGKLHFLQEHDIVKIGEDELKVLLTPGHSPGSICFYCEKQQFIIGGDVLFNESIGRTDLPGGNYETLLESIREKLFVLPDDVIVYPGHGVPTTIGHEKKYNPFLNMIA